MKIISLVVTDNSFICYLAHLHLFKSCSKKVLPADSVAALSPPGPSHQQQGRPLDFQLTLPGHWSGGFSTKGAVSFT